MTEMSTTVESIHEPIANRGLSQLKTLEAESIYILREAAAEFARPVMLYSIGKDSSVMLRLAQKAFYPGHIPFPLLHIDTSYKFPEMIDFPRFLYQGDRRPADRPPESRSPGTGRESLRSGNPKMLRLAQDQIAARCSGRGWVRRGFRRSPPR